MSRPGPLPLPACRTLAMVSTSSSGNKYNLVIGHVNTLNTRLSLVNIISNWSILISVNGLRLHYVESGDPGKPLLLFVHGWPQFWFAWRHQIEHFQKVKINKPQRDNPPLKSLSASLI